MAKRRDNEENTHKTIESIAGEKREAQRDHAHRPGCIGRMFRMLLLAAMIVGLACVVVLTAYHFANDNQKKQMDDIADQGKDRIEQLQDLVSDKSEQVLTDSQREKLDRLTEQARGQFNSWTRDVRGGMSDLFVSELGPRSVYSQAWDDAGLDVLTPPTASPVAMEARLKQIDDLAGMRQSMAALVSIDAERLEIERQLLMLLRDNADQWTVNEAGEISFKADDVAAKYAKIKQRFDDLAERQKLLLDALKQAGEAARAREVKASAAASGKSDHGAVEDEAVDQADAGATDK